MGNTDTKSQIQQLSKFYKQVQQFQHPFLGNLKRVTASKQNHDFNETQNKQTINILTELKQHKYLIIKQNKFTHQEGCKSAIERWKKRKNLSEKKNAKNIMKLLNIASEKQSEICGITYFGYCFFENYDTDLNQIIATRKSTGNHFDQKQLAHFLYSVCSGIIFLNDYNMKNYCISSTSIVYNAEQNVYKILDTQIAKQLHPYIKILNGIPIEAGTYLSPQLIQELINKNTDPQSLYSPKSDVFSLGIVMLQMCTLNSMQKLYNYQKISLNYSLIKSTIDSLSYSQYLKNIIQGMLQIQEDQRLGFVSIKQKLSNLDETYSNTHSTVPIGSLYGYQARNSSITNITQKTVKGIRELQHNQNNAHFRPYVNHYPMNYMNQNNQNHGVLQHPYNFNSNQQKNNYEIRDRIRTQYRPLSPIISRKNNHNQQIQNRNRAISFDLQNKQSNRQYTNQLKGDVTNIQINKHYVPEQFLQTYQQKVTYQPQTFIKQYKQDSFITHRNNQYNNQVNKKYNHSSNSIDSSWNQSNTVITSMEVLGIKPHQSETFKNQSPSVRKQIKTSENELQSLRNSEENTPIRKIQALQETTNKKRNTIAEILNQIQQEEKQDVDDNYDHSKRMNYGKHTFTNGAMYQGQFDNQGNFSGSGILYYPDKTICYSGNWSNNCFHGFGVLINQKMKSNQPLQPTNFQNFALNSQYSWDRYEGQFKMDKKNGFGTLFMRNKDKFCGSFIDDVIQGYGTYTSAQGKIVSGLWNSNILKKI